MKKALLFIMSIISIFLLTNCNSNKSKTVLIIKNDKMFAFGQSEIKLDQNGSQINYFVPGAIVIFKTDGNILDQQGFSGVVYKIDKDLLLTELETIDTASANNEIVNKYLKNKDFKLLSNEEIKEKERLEQDKYNSKVQELLKSLPIRIGTYTDIRDGRKYKTIRIGNQNWMAENFAFQPTSGHYWVYDNDKNNINKYGYLYDWETAQTIVPEGWHLPTYMEWSELIEFLGNNEEKVYDLVLEGKSSGLNIVFGGCFDVNNKFIRKGEGAYYWSSHKYQNDDIIFQVSDSLKKARVQGFSDKYGCSVRLLQN